LATVRAAVGSLDRVRQVVKVFGMVNSAFGFDQQAEVMNGFSDLMVEVFGDEGRHARTVVGVGELPRGIAGDIEAILEIDLHDARPTRPAPPSSTRLRWMFHALLRPRALGASDLARLVVRHGTELVAELLQDGGPKFVAVDRLLQVRLKARRLHARTLRVGRDQGDGRYRPSEADVEMLKLGEELAPRRFGRCEVAHDDIGDERGTKRVVGLGGGDERAREFEHRPKVVVRELVVIDHQDVNPSEFRRQFVHLLLAWSAPCRMRADGQGLTPRGALRRSSPDPCRD
jgi:YjgF/chorismate_mutase-like, putative endoribonuclease